MRSVSGKDRRASGSVRRCQMHTGCGPAMRCPVRAAANRGPGGAGPCPSLLAGGTRLPGGRVQGRIALAVKCRDVRACRQQSVDHSRPGGAVQRRGARRVARAQAGPRPRQELHDAHVRRAGTLQRGVQLPWHVCRVYGVCPCSRGVWVRTEETECRKGWDKRQVAPATAKQDTSLPLLSQMSHSAAILHPMQHAPRPRTCTARCSGVQPPAPGVLTAARAASSSRTAAS